MYEIQRKASRQQHFEQFTVYISLFYCGRNLLTVKIRAAALIIVLYVYGLKCRKCKSFKKNQRKMERKKGRQTERKTRLINIRMLRL